MKESPIGYTKGPLPTYIGVSEKDLPDSDMRIRFFFQVKHSSLDAILNILKTMQSPSSPDPIPIKELNGILIIDRIYNIKNILAVINELDQMYAPEAMSIIRLKTAEARKIIDLYQAIIKEENNNQMPPKATGVRRVDLVTYFDPQVRLFADIRTNTIIALGDRESLDKVELFIKNYEEKIPKLKHMPVHIYRLKYTQADAMANVLRQAIGFKGETDAGKFNGVKDGHKFLANISIFSEQSTNSLLIQCGDDEYKHIYTILKELDIEQHQVGIDMLIVSVDVEKMKSLGAQLRNKVEHGSTINFQTGTLDSSVGVVGNYPKGSAGEGMSGNQRLMGNLLNLLIGSSGGAGSTIISLGNDANGVWGLVKLLVNETEAKILNNPFLIVTNKYEASINVGETRRIAATTITNSNNQQQSYQSDDASLSINVHAQIIPEEEVVKHDGTIVHHDGSVICKIKLSMANFINGDTNVVSAGNKVTKALETSTNIPDNNIVVIGGLTLEHIVRSVKSVPFLSKIPLIGWLFKNESKEIRRSMLLIFLKATIIYTEEQLSKINQVRKNMFCDQEKMLEEKNSSGIACPLEKLYFGKNDSVDNHLHAFWGSDRKGLEKIKEEKVLGNDKEKNAFSKEVLVNDSNYTLEEKKESNSVRYTRARSKRRKCSQDKKEGVCL